MARDELELDRPRGGAMLLRAPRLVCLFTIAFCAGRSAAAPMFIDLGALGSGAIPYGISPDGSTVVGQSGGDAFVWDAASGMRAIVMPAQVNFGSAEGASYDGSKIVGVAFSDTGGEAFVWDAQNGMQGLGDLPGGDFESFAAAVSDDGSIVVGFGFDSDSNQQAFVWDPTNGMQGIGDLDGGALSSYASDVSGNGAVVVGRGTNAAFELEAFIWDAPNGMRGLGDLPGGSFYSSANAISSDGSTAVGVSHSALGTEAFVWDELDGIRGLGLLPGGTYSEAFDVSADGSVVVGVASIPTTGVVGRAFVWDAVTGMRRLDQVLTELGLDLSGWRLHQATAISDDGRVITGYGTNASGERHAWYAVIPEPSTGLLVGFGLAALVLHRRRAL